ncbi:MAG: DUF309 domain-containing protein [Lacipirellulaceae bacterium]
MRVRRYSAEPFPAYAYVPGQTPRPPDAHRADAFTNPSDCPVPLDAATGAANPLHRYAIDLFNAGYRWEAHEAWERLWIAHGRAGPTADFIKGLIKLAAAGVKHRTGRPGGVTRHARRAAELFAATRATLGPVVAGIDLAALELAALRVASKGWDEALRIELVE